MNKIGKSSVRLAFLTIEVERAAPCSTHQTAIPRGSEVMGRKPNRKSKKGYLPTLPRGSVVKRPSTPSCAKRLEVFASYLRLLLSLFQSLPGSNRCLGPGSLPWPGFLFPSAHGTLSTVQSSMATMHLVVIVRRTPGLAKASALPGMVQTTFPSSSAAASLHLLSFVVFRGLHRESGCFREETATPAGAV